MVFYLLQDLCNYYSWPSSSLYGWSFLEFHFLILNKCFPALKWKRSWNVRINLSTWKQGTWEQNANNNITEYVSKFQLFIAWGNTAHFAKSPRCLCTSNSCQNKQTFFYKRKTVSYSQLHVFRNLLRKTEPK